MATERVAHQPLHPSLLPKIDPGYLAFHTSVLQYLPLPDPLKWDPAVRNTPTVPGGSDPLAVEKTQDFNIGKTKVRTYTPKGEVPEGGWPVFIFFHGGGWTLGRIDSEASFSTHMAVGAHCVVVSVDYRLAPEDPYPAAVEDAVESLDWVVAHGKQELGINTARIAVGGSSSGGNLATILALKAAERSDPIPLVFQLLVVPVIDNTASASTLWAANQNAPWLSPFRMEWFRNNYLPNQSDRTKWDASPIFAPKELLSKLPRAWIGVGELDILKEEGVLYGEKLKEQGVEVETKVYEGGPHPIMAMDGEALEIGRRLVSDAAKALTEAFSKAK